MILLISTIHVLVCLFLIMVVLLQQGKGADLSVFGGGGSQAAFGARGAATLLHKLTVFGFIGFIVTTMAIGLFSGSSGTSSVITGLPAEAVEESAPPSTEPVATTDDIAPAAEAAVDETTAGEAAAEEVPTTAADGEADDGSEQ